MRSRANVMIGRVLAVLLPWAVVATTAAASAQTLKTIKDRGTLVCGVSDGIIGFSRADADGAWSGFDVDFCRALAAAILDDAGKVKFISLSTGDRFPALQSGQIDVLSRNSSWTMSRETDLGLMFAAATFYDGQGFMLRRSRNITTALDLGGSKVCVQSGTTSELNLADYFDANGMTYQAVPAASADDAAKAYDAGRCDVLTSDAAQLHAERLKMSRPNDHDILADIISKEPLGPAVRQGDPQWFNIVKWTHFAMVNAEELGVGSATIEGALASNKPDVRRLVGNEGNYGEQIGLTRDWAARIVRLVGNYSDVYERNVGTKSRLAIPRGINQLWSNGGIMYAPPIR